MRINAALFYVFSFLLGMYLVHTSWNSVRFVSLTTFRAPAAANGLRDFSGQRGQSLSTAVQFQMSSQSQIHRMDGGYEVSLNQFVLRDRNDKRNFICRIEDRPGVFDRVEVKLYGIGISEAGRVPRITVQTDCQSRVESDEIKPIRVFIPLAELYKLKPLDQEISFYDDTKTELRVSEMVSEWPLEWQLEEVTYLNSSDPSHKLTLALSNNESSTSGALTLHWSETEDSKTAEQAPQTF